MKILSDIARAVLLLIVFAGASSAAVDYPQSDNERNVLQAVQTLRSAQRRYYSTSGNGNYGSLRALRRVQLINAALATGNKYGYVFIVSLTPPTPTSSAAYALTATPRVYRRGSALVNSAASTVKYTAKTRAACRQRQPIRSLTNVLRVR